MKKPYLITLFILINLLVFSQSHEVLFDDSGNPALVRLYEKGSVQKYFIEEVSEDGVYTIEPMKVALLLMPGIQKQFIRKTMLRN